MRNIFDQYSQPENRITHALMTAINEDRRLLGLFLRELLKVKASAAPRTLLVLEQQYPGEEEPSEEERGLRGIPDGWIFDQEGWCVFIETKVLAKIDAGQINRHRRTAERRGFHSITAVAIAPRPLLPTSVPAETILLEWRSVYAWLRRHSSSSVWAARTAEYLEIAEAKMIGSKQFVEGTLTMFSGFPFGHDHPFTYLEGKRVLELVMSELKSRRELVDRLGINPKAAGRSAITGRERDGVWDFLSLSATSENDKFTKYPHLTLRIDSQAVEAWVIVPNAVNNTMRKNLIKLGEAGFQALADDIVNNLQPPLHHHEGATPRFRGQQRRYPSQSAIPYVDARIDFDLRTAIPSGGPPKTQPRWLSAAYGSFENKQGSNYEIAMGVQFRYECCPELRRADAIDLIAAAWLACKPLVDLGRQAA